jgi:hypothetical protein
MQQAGGAGGNFVDRGIESGLVSPRRFVKSGDLSHELERRIPNFIGRNRRVEVEKVLDVSAHSTILPGIFRYELGPSSLGRKTRHEPCHVDCLEIWRVKDPDLQVPHKL